MHVVAMMPSHTMCRQQSKQGNALGYDQRGAAWPSQRPDTAFGRGANPFKGRGKWGHDLFEELTRTPDEATQVKPNDMTQAPTVADAKQNA